MTRPRLPGRSAAPAYAACFITSPASKLAPLSHTARVTAAAMSCATRTTPSVGNPRQQLARGVAAALGDQYPTRLPPQPRQVL